MPLSAAGAVHVKASLVLSALVWCVTPPGHVAMTRMSVDTGASEPALAPAKFVYVAPRKGATTRPMNCVAELVTVSVYVASGV